MASVTKSISDFNIKSTWNGVRWLEVEKEVDVNLSSIPAGSTITAATLSGTIRSQMFGGTFKCEGVTLGTPTDNEAHTFSKSLSSLVNTSSFTDITLTFSFKTTGRSGYSQDYGYFSDLSLKVTYTLPYTACTAPTSVTAASTNVAPGATVRVSWSGAKAGTNNAISSYTVYRSSDNSTWSKLKSGVTSAYLDVTAPTSNGSTYYYKVATIGTVSGYDSAKSSATATVKCSFSAPSVSAVKIDSSASAVYKAAGASASLTWSSTAGTNNAIKSYDVYQGTTKLGNTTSKSYSVTTPSAGTSATFYVVPVGTYSDGSKVASPALYGYSAPTAPTAVSVGENNVAPGVSVTLSWSGAKAGNYNSITGYRIMRATSATGTYSQVGSDISSTETSGSASVTSHATNGSSYYYKVVTLGARSNSSQSSVYAQLTTTWTNPTVSSLKLDGSTADQYRPSGTSLALTWTGTNGTNNAISKYEVYRSGTKLGETTETTYTVSANATAGGNYAYQVKAIGVLSDSALSTAITVYTYSDPVAPDSVVADNPFPDAGTNTTIRWSGAQNGSLNQIIGYRVFRAAAVGGTYTQLGADLGENVSSLTVTAPGEMGASYYYKVMALGQRSNSALSDPVTVTAQTYTVPSAPVASVASATPDAGTQTLLSWQDAAAGTNNPITGYRVMRASSEDGPYTQLGEDLSASASSLAVDAPGTMGSRYFFKVYAIGTKSGFLLSPASNTVAIMAQVYTRCTAPTAQISATLANPGVNVTLSWSGAEGGTNNPITGYKIYESNGSGYSLFASVNADVLSITNPVGTPGTVHSLKVIAVGAKSGFESYDSNIVSVRVNTPPAVISKFTLPSLVYESGTLAFSWSAPADPDGNIISYAVQRRIESASSVWGEWVSMTGTDVTAYADQPSVNRGLKFQYRVAAVDALGLQGEWAATSEFIRNSAPLAPVILHPGNNAITYDEKPRFLLDVKADADKQKLRVLAAVDQGEYAEIGTVAAGKNMQIAVQYTAALAAGTHTFRLILMDDLGAASSAASVSVTVTDPSWSREIVRGTVVANASISHQQEILQLYQQVNHVLAYYGQDALTVPDLVGSSTPSPGAGKIGMFAAWGVQMAELQNALKAIYDLMGFSPASWTKVSSGMAPAASVISEIRAAISRL